jgi:uncharacterized membrane protein YdjX (TVP38/TMEM64 family)
VKRAWLRLGGLVLVVAGLAIVVRATGLGEEIVRAAGAWRRAAASPAGPALWVAIYAVAATLAVPGTALTVAGGVAFGFPRGAALNLLGGTLGAVTALLLARFVARAAAERLFGKLAARLGMLADARRAFLVFLRLRLIPLVPSNGLNYAAGLTRAPLTAFAAGSALGFIPSTVAYTYFAAALASGGASERGALGKIFAVLAAACAAAILPTLVRLARRGKR